MQVSGSTSPQIVTFRTSPSFPFNKIILSREPLCRVMRGTPNGERESQLYHYQPTDNTVQIHAAIREIERKRAKRLRVEDRTKEADYRDFTLSLADFGRRYRTEKRDRLEQRSRWLPPLPPPRFQAFGGALAPLRMALEGNWPSDEPLASRVARLKDRMFEASYPGSPEIWAQPEEMIPFILETLRGEQAEGWPYVRRMEQRGRRHPEI